MSENVLLKELTIPDKIFFTTENEENRYGKFIIYPFERGFGITVGNTLRRVLLSSIEGYAISSIRVTSYDKNGNPKFLSSEFDFIPGVLEDTLEIIANLKNINLVLENDLKRATFTIELNGSQTNVLKAEHFENESLKILNKDLVIAHLESDANFTIEFQVDYGRGYISSEDYAKYIEEVNTIAIDTIFSPIVKVKYAIENTRVGQRSDYDKLVIEIWTNGSIMPKDALSRACKILIGFFSTIGSFDYNSSIQDKSLDDLSILSDGIEKLDLSVRAYNCLKNINVKTLGDLILKSSDELSKTKNFGKKSLDEIIEKLSSLGLSLGMTREEARETLKIKS